MSTSIDERIVEMRFDNRNFENNVKTTMSTLDKLKEKLKLKGISDGLENVSKASQKCDFSPISKSIDTVETRFSHFQATVQHQLNRITDSAIDTGRRIVNAFTFEPVHTGFDEYELKMSSVQTIMASTGESLETVNEYLNELNTYSDKTIYSFSDMTQNIGKFTNAGVKLKDAVAAIKGVSNEAAVSGANANEASRAMYNFAQALSAGYVKLIDWKSIENANMATVEFKNELIKTAEELGTVVKVGDQYRSVTTNANGAISEAFDATHNFNDALAHQWMTTEVLTQTLGKYADETTDIGKKAYASAQDVKTFSMMMDTLKEAAQSGWAQTWELIIGDFNQAKKLFTEASNFFGGIIDNASKARNRFLGGALQNIVTEKDWLNLKKAGKGTKNFQKLLIELAKEHNIAIDSMIKTEGNFANTLKNGWLTADIYKEAVGMVKDAEQDVIKERTKGIKNAKEKAKVEQELNDKAKEGNKAYNALAKEMNKTTGRELVIDTIRNSLKFLVQEISSVKNSWNDIFPPVTSDQLYDAIKKIHTLSEKLKTMDENGSKIGRTFKGLFSILHLVSSLVGGTFKIGLKLVQAVLGKFNMNILDVTASIGDTLVNFDKWVEENRFVSKSIDSVATVLADGIETLADWINTIGEIPKVQEIVVNFDDTFRKMAESVSSRVGETEKRIDSFIGRVKSLDHISLDNIGSILKDFYENVLSYAFNLDSIYDSSTKKFSSLRDRLFGGMDESDDRLRKFKNTTIDYSKKIRDTLGDLDIFGPLLTLGTGVGIYKTANRLMKIYENMVGFMTALKGPLLALKNALNGMIPVLKAFAFSLKAKAVKDIAIAIAILAGSLAVLSLCNSKKLIAAAVALAIVTGALTGLCAVLGAFKIKDIGKVTGSILSLSAALLIVVIALKQMETISMDGIWDRLLVLGALATGLLVFGGLASMIPGINKGALAILAFGVALRIIINAVKDIDKIKTDGINQAVKALGKLTLIMSVLALATSKLGLRSTAGLLLMAVSLRIFSKSMLDLCKIDFDNIKSGLATLVIIFGMFGGLIAASYFAGEHAAKAGVMMLTMSVSLLIIAKAIKKIAKIRNSDIFKGTIVISGIMALFTYLIAVSKFAGKHAAKAGAMLLGMSATFLAISVAMAMIGHLKDDQVNRALKAITGISACFSLLIISSRFSKDAKTSITAMTVAIGAIAVALGALSFIDPERLRSTTVALSVTMAMFAAMIMSTYFIGEKLAPIIAMIAVVTALGTMIAIIAQMPVENALAAAGSMSILMYTLTASLTVLSNVKGLNNPKILLSLAALAGAMVIIGTIVGLMQKLDIVPSIETAVALSTFLLAMSATCVVLSIVGKAAGHALLGAVALDGVLAIIGALVLGIGALFSQDFMSKGKEYMEKGFEILNVIAHGLGSFVGNIIGGFAAGALSGLPQMGTYISEFATNIKGFMDGMSDVDPSVAESAKSLATALLAICGANLLDNIAGWLGSKTDMAEFGNKLESFGEGIVKFSDVVKDKIDAKSVEAAANAGKLITELASTVPNEGGWASTIMGENDIKVFGSKLESFAQGIVDFSNVVKNGKIDEGTVQTATNAGKLMTELAETVPNEGGWASAIMGENDIKVFGSKLKSFAQGIVDFSDVVKNGNIETKSMKTASEAAKLMIKLAKAVPNDGGVIGFWCGNNDIKEFGEKLKDFGDGLADFCNGELSKVSLGVLQNTVRKITEIIEAITVVNDANTSNVRNFNSAMKELGKTSIDGFIEEFESGGNRTKDAINSFFTSTLEAMRFYNGMFYNAGNNATQGFIDGLKAKISSGELYNAAFQIGQIALDAAKKALDEHSPSKKMKKVGSFAIDGFIQGIQANKVKIGVVTKAVFTDFIAQATKIANITKYAKGVIASYASNFAADSKKTSKAAKEAQKAIQAYIQSIYEKSDYYKEDKQNLQNHLKQLREYYNERKKLEAKYAKSKDSSTKKSLKENKKNINDLKKQIDNDFKNISKNIEKTYNEAKKVIRDVVKDYTDVFKATISSIDVFGDVEISGKDAIKSNIKDVLSNLTSLSDISLDSGINMLQSLSSSLNGVSNSASSATSSIEDLETSLQDANDELKESEDELRKAQARSLAVQGRSKTYLDAVAEAEEKVAESKQKVAEAEKKLASAKKENNDSDEESLAAGKELLDNMKSNIDAYTEWQKNLDTLSQTNISKELLNNLRGLGIDGAEQVSAFVKMTKEELDKANEYWKTYTDISSKTLIDGLKEKSNSMTEWGNNIKLFANLEIDDKVKAKLLKEFQEQGVDSSEYLKQILSMNADELNSFVASYKSMIEIPEQVAENVAKSIDDINKKTDNSKETMNNYLDLMKSNLKAEKEYQSNLKKLKKKGVSDGLYDQIAESGDKSLAASFANATKEDIDAANKIYADTAKQNANNWLDSYSSNITDAEKWDENMKKLAKLNIPKKIKQALYKEFQEKGIEGNDLLEVILGFDEKQLKKFVASYKKTGSVANATANDVIAGAVSVSEDTKKKIKKSYSDLAKESMDAMADAVKKYSKKVKNASKKSSTDSRNEYKKRHNKKTGDSDAKNYHDGFSEGQKNHGKKSKKAAKETAEDILKTIRKVYGIASPSKVLKKYGMYMNEGLAIGIRQSSGLASKEAMLSSDKVLSNMQNSINKVSAWANSDIDSNPTIRPILDLDEIKKQANQINSMFGTESIGVNADMASAISNRMNTSSGIQNSSTTNNSYDQSTQTINNTFNISGNNPKEIANDVSKILQEQVNRRSTVWA